MCDNIRITCGLPYIHEAQEGDKELALSQGVRITALALGTLSFIAGIALLCTLPSLGQALPSALIFPGAGFVLLSLTLQYVKDHASVIEEEEAKIAAERQANLMKFYQTNDIYQGDEPIAVDTNQLDFSPCTEDESIQLRSLTQKLIEEINRQTSNNSTLKRDDGTPNKQMSVEECRKIRIPILEGQFSLLKPKYIPSRKDLPDLGEKEYTVTFLGYAIEKLMEKGLIFEIIEWNGRGYLIQA